MRYSDIQTMNVSEIICKKMFGGKFIRHVFGISTIVFSLLGTGVFADEMATYREIIEREIATRQDLADLIAMQNEEFDTLSTSGARLQKLAEITGMNFTAEDAARPVNRGEVAKAMMLVFNIEAGFMFYLTSWERYALRDVQQAGIMQTKFSEFQVLSGMQLVGIVNNSAENAEKSVSWGQ